LTPVLCSVGGVRATLPFRPVCHGLADPETRRGGELTRQLEKGCMCLMEPSEGPDPNPRGRPGLDVVHGTVLGSEFWRTGRREGGEAGPGSFSPSSTTDPASTVGVGEGIRTCYLVCTQQGAPTVRSRPPGLVPCLFCSTNDPQERQPCAHPVGRGGLQGVRVGRTAATPGRQTQLRFISIVRLTISPGAARRREVRAPPSRLQDREDREECRATGRN
jgi:hypothetical protein